MIPRSRLSRPGAPRQPPPDAARPHARLLALTGPTHEQALCVLVLAEPDHATQELLAHYQQDAGDRGLGFMAVVCPHATGGLSASLVPLLRDHLGGQAMFVFLDPRQGDAASTSNAQARALAGLIEAHGFDINFANSAQVDVHDPFADMALGEIHLMFRTLKRLRADDNPDARVVLALLDDPEQGTISRRYMLVGANDHYLSNGAEPLLPLWYRLGTSDSPAAADDPFTAGGSGSDSGSDSGSGAGADADAGAGSIADALSGWVAVSEGLIRSPAWQAIEQRADSGSLRGLVERLGEMFPARDQPAIRQRLGRLVRALCSDPGFADTAFALCTDATSSCTDRVALVLNQLDAALRAQRVATGELDHQLPAVIEVARQAFRLNQLDRIAREKVRRLQREAADRPGGGEHLEPLETHLAYLHELHHALALGGEPPDARYTSARLSGVTDIDLEQALHATRAAENREFADALADWGPWQQVLARLDPDGVAALKEELANPDVWAGLDDDVRALAIEAGTPLGELALTVSLHRNRRALEITRERWLALTLRLLDRLGQRELIEPRWH